MTPDQLAQLQRETRSSIEVERTAKQDYKWTVKVYFEDGQEKDALDTLEAIDSTLRVTYLVYSDERPKIAKAGE